MKFSVLVVTCNRQLLLKDNLDSLVSQIYKDKFEVIVIDNGSSDKTCEVVELYKNKLNIKYFFEPKKSIPIARNRSVSESKGEIVVFIDDDCIASKDWLAQIDRQIKRGSDIVVGWSKSRPVGSVPLIEQYYYERWILQNGGNLNKVVNIKKGTLFDTKNLALKKSILLDNNLKFDVDFENKNEDFELGIRIYALDYIITFSPNVLVYHLNSTSLNSLFVKNLQKGASIKQVEMKHSIYLSQVIVKEKLPDFYSQFIKSLSTLDKFTSKVKFFFLVLIYPLSYKWGKTMSN